MRFSLCCVKCDQVIQLGWKLCPQCGIRVEEGENVSTDRLRESIKSDVAKFYAANNFWRGDEFITEAAKTCLFDWQWASKLGFPEGQWFVARCYDRDELVGFEREFGDAGRALREGEAQPGGGAKTSRARARRLFDELAG